MPIVYRSGNFDYIDWKVPIEHFLWDRLAEAHAEASVLAVGSLGQYLSWYRMIEAEWLTRSRSETVTVRPWLRFETLQDSEDVHWGEDARPSPSPQMGTGQLIAQICEETALAFGIEERPEVLVSVLSPESEAPWVDGRAGYFIDKYPYDKICIPQRSLTDLDDLREVVAHEYTHALNLVLTQGKCPLWLNEGMAMLSQRTYGGRVRESLASGRTWKNPHTLDAAFHAELQGDRDFGTIHTAYEQAAWIVHFLLTLGDQEKLGNLMRAFNDNTLLGELKMRFTAETPADEALRQIYGMGETELFSHAHEWLRSS